MFLRFILNLWCNTFDGLFEEPSNSSLRGLELTMALLTSLARLSAALQQCATLSPSTAPCIALLPQY
ncbi:unnamed protein product [Allacma fusca]|uniref:Uncharacterized protein n=1 Tax=Allacma fusca TaxID=39272 RepID=A0A8J2LF08_9HEXA|nr:unnamed protein product [Allacma fusca]